MLAENALTTLERMKLMLGLSDIEDEKVNLIVELLINKASSWIERQTGRHLGKRSVPPVVRRGWAAGTCHGRIPYHQR